MAEAYLTLFVADINRAFDGLESAIDNGPSIDQAALHAHDLADALGCIGLTQLSAMSSDVSAELSLGQPGALDRARQLVHILQEALQILDGAEGTTVDTEQVEGVNALYANRMDEEAVQPEHQPAESMPDLSKRTSAQSMQDFLALGSASTAYAAQPQERHLSQPVPEWQRQRLLNQSQKIRAKALQDHPVAELDLMLCEHQDSILELAQVNLEDFFTELPFEVSMSRLMVDLDIAESLKLIANDLEGIQKLVASKQALTVFIDIHGSDQFEVSPQRMKEIGTIVARKSGRLELFENGLRLILPCSLRRMRVVPIVRAGVAYVLSWAQMLAISAKTDGMVVMDKLGSLEDGQTLIKVGCGHLNHMIQAAEIQLVTTMNMFDMPSALQPPSWMRGVGIGANNQVYSWISLAEPLK